MLKTIVPNIRRPIHALHGPAESHRVGNREIPFRDRDIIDHAVIVEPIGVFGWDHRRWRLGSPENWGFPAGIQLIPGNKQGGKKRVIARASGEREMKSKKKGMFFSREKRIWERSRYLGNGWRLIGGWWCWDSSSFTEYLLGFGLQALLAINWASALFLSWESIRHSQIRSVLNFFFLSLWIRN